MFAAARLKVSDPFDSDLWRKACQANGVRAVTSIRRVFAVARPKGSDPINYQHRRMAQRKVDSVLEVFNGAADGARTHAVTDIQFEAGCLDRRVFDRDDGCEFFPRPNRAMRWA